MTMPSFSIRSLLPASKLDYFRYLGSLTSVPCHESVIWFVFRSHVNVTPDQVRASASFTGPVLRKLNEEPIVDRPEPGNLQYKRIVQFVLGYLTKRYA